MTIARIDGGAVAEYRELAMGDVPEHKRILWLPVTRVGSGAIETVTIAADGVTLTRSNGDLDACKRAAARSVNAVAESERMQYLTPGAGQALTYNAKLDEARLILLDPAAADALDSAALRAAFPMVWASIPSDGATASTVAAMVQAKALAWAQVGAAIEKKRNTLLDAIDAAQTVEAVNAVVW